MGLKKVFQDVAVAMIDAFDDVPVSIIYHSTGTIDYNTPSGVTTETNTTNYVINKVFVFSYKSEEIDGEKIKQTDQKLMIPCLSMPVTPKMSDYVLFEVGGAVWNIVKDESDKDPTDSWYIFQIRRP
jgi:hypothetical protein